MINVLTLLRIVLLLLNSFISLFCVARVVWKIISICVIDLNRLTLRLKVVSLVTLYHTSIIIEYTLGNMLSVACMIILFCLSIRDSVAHNRTYLTCISSMKWVIQQTLLSLSVVVSSDTDILLDGIMCVTIGENLLFVELTHTDANIIRTNAY